MKSFPVEKVHYKIIGQGNPFVVISGIPSDHRIIQSWMEPIFEKRSGWQRIYFDLPGTGKTPGNGINSIDQVLNVVCDFIDRVIHNQQFTLLGLSVGGYLAQGVVLRKARLIDGVAFLVPWFGDEDKSLPASISMQRDPQAMEKLSPEDAKNLAGLAVIQNQKVVDWYRQVVIAARKEGQGIELRQKTYTIDLLEGFEPFEKPALILTGRQDSHVGYHAAWETLACYPRATFAVLDCAGHALGVEQEGLFQALVNEWLDRVEELKSSE